MQRAHGLPDERASADAGWREGYRGTRYLRVELTQNAVPVDHSNQSLYLSGDGRVTRGVRIANKETLIESLDRGKFR